MNISAQARGIWAERQAYLHFKKRGYQFLHHRLKTPFAEVDLVLRSPQGVLCVVEVKTLGSWNHLAHRVSPRQRQRLLRAQAWMAEKENGCLLMLAVVVQAHEVLVFEDVFR